MYNLRTFYFIIGVVHVFMGTPCRGQHVGHHYRNTRANSGFTCGSCGSIKTYKCGSISMTDEQRNIVLEDPYLQMLRQTEPGSIERESLLEEKRNQTIFNLTPEQENMLLEGCYRDLFPANSPISPEEGPDQDVPQSRKKRATGRVCAPVGPPKAVYLVEDSLGNIVQILHPNGLQFNQVVYDEDCAVGTPSPPHGLVTCGTAERTQSVYVFQLLPLQSRSRAVQAKVKSCATYLP